MKLSEINLSNWTELWEPTIKKFPNIKENTWVIKAFDENQFWIVDG